MDLVLPSAISTGVQAAKQAPNKSVPSIAKGPSSTQAGTIGPSTAASPVAPTLPDAAASELAAAVPPVAGPPGAAGPIDVATAAMPPEVAPLGVEPSWLNRASAAATVEPPATLAAPAETVATEAAEALAEPVAPAEAEAVAEPVAPAAEASAGVASSASYQSSYQGAPGSARLAGAGSPLPE
jgi:hypothetical protein